MKWICAAAQSFQKCCDIVDRFLNEDELFVSDRKKESAKFYTAKDTADISDYLSSKKGMPSKSLVIGILDTKSRDLVFTTTGIIVPRSLHETKEIPYGVIRMVRGDIKIGDVKFDNSEINNSALERLINALMVQVSATHYDNCLVEFKQKLATFSI